MKFYHLFFIILFLFSCKKENIVTTEKYDLIITGAEILLPNGTTTHSNLFIKDGKIAKIDSTNSNLNSDKIIQAGGKFIMPGFIDAHAHFIGIGQYKDYLDLLSTTSWDEILEEVKKKTEDTQTGKWIIGRGWHQEKWTDDLEFMVKGFPTNQQLSAISPNHPVILYHASSHGLIANQKAMEIAGISAETKVPEGGLMLMEPNGNPTGVFQENAMKLIEKAYEKSNSERTVAEKYNEWLYWLKLAENECLRNGITTVHDAGISWEDAKKFQKLANNNELNVRLYSMLMATDLLKINKDSLTQHFLVTRENKFFTNRATKAFVDGALGSHGAWLLQDYSDRPGYRGENVTDLDTLKKIAHLAHDFDLQLCIHAIGDRGNQEVINIFQEEWSHELAQKRWRIEHAQHLNPEDIKRMSSSGIIASVQTVHCTSDASFVEKRLGKKRAEEGAYVWQTLLANNIHLANGTDAPVEEVNPFENIYAAVTRRKPNDSITFFPNQKLTRKQALEIYTQGNAFAGFEEDWKGKIQENYVADLVILDKNLLQCDDKEILNTKVLYTIVDGEIKYEAEN